MSEAYLGNQNLKRKNVAISYTHDELEEYVRCLRSPDYFITNYVKIVSVDKGLIPFSMYDYQKDIVQTAIDNRYVICKMPRQCGKTTTIAALMLWFILFNENYSIAILANKLSQSREILSRVQLAYEHLPKWLQQGIVEWNKGNIELENGSKILASATSSSAIRGTSQNLIYLDEFAFVPNNLQEDFFTSVFPTISSGNTSKVLITSTPNGLNMFYKLWTDSEHERNDYKRISVHWSQVPGRDENWKLETIRNTSEEQFKQEFECEFLGSSNTLIDAYKLRMLTHIPPIKSNPNINIYSEPSTNGLYMVVVDTSRGTGQDYSAFVVFDVSSMPYKVACVYRNNEISPLIFPNVIQQFARHYNSAYVLVESNDIGKQVADILFYELEYENVFFTSNDRGAGQQIAGGFKGGSVIGVKTSRSVKKIGCSSFKALVENDQLIINDYQLLYELFRFSLSGDSYEAEEGNDDLVMCCVLFSWLMNQPYVRELTNTDLRLTLSEANEKMIEDELLPFGLVDSGHDMHEEQPLIAVSANDDVNWLM
jgi:Terminase large subunit, T4likevirus-type, N-terminal/Terminase RNaseH-like domain